MSVTDVLWEAEDQIRGYMTTGCQDEVLRRWLESLIWQMRAIRSLPGMDASPKRRMNSEASVLACLLSDAKPREMALVVELVEKETQANGQNHTT